MGNIESVAKAALEKLKEMNMVENAKEIVKRTTPFVSEYARILFDGLLENLKQIVVKTMPVGRTSSDWLLENLKQIVVKTMPFVRTSSDWLLENAKEIVVKTTPVVRTSSDWLLENAKEIVVKTTPFVRTSSDWLLEKAPARISTSINSIRIAPIYYTIPIGFLLILFLRRCCSGGDGGNGKTMKAPGRNNVRILENAKEIVVKTTPFVRTSSDWLLVKAPALISTSINSIRIAPIYYTIPIGFLLILFLCRCCSGGGGGNGKTMKAPGRNNVRILRRNFESSPKSYFRDLRSRKN
ncbi:uncharacterized protein LOC125850095 isoform X1 [Solanum stenotomum]|uniref:uncharacterized protein LOC125850095 isoform X1 n=1 Tax=Solanum stenotomum TaxID=172797 RepID=UPI0020D1E848|nr:uncharacterized protein LOC125850095 isoform X1 [Solanum stenotomum]